MYAQSIHTVAGGGPIGDGRPATAALLSGPADVAFDPLGNLHIADSSHHLVRRVDAATGLIATIAGGGSSGVRDGGKATDSEVRAPRSIAFAPNGDLYIAQHGPRIFRVDTNGIITTVVSDLARPADGVGDGGPASAARLGWFQGIATDTHGNLYIASTTSDVRNDPVNNRIRRIDARTGIITTVAGSGGAPGFSGDGGPATAAMLSEPHGVAVDSKGNIYFVEAGNHRLRRVDAATGIITTFAGNGVAQNTGDGGPARQASLNLTNARIAIDAADNIYISLPGLLCCQRIRRIDSATGMIDNFAGTVAATTDSAGEDDVPATSVPLDYPAGLTADTAGNVYFAESARHRIRKVDISTRIMTTVAGGGLVEDGVAPTSTHLFNPQGVALDSTGSLYISDHLNNRVRKVTPDLAVIHTVAGNGRSRGGRDGVPATETAVALPTWVATDADNNLYFVASLHQGPDKPVTPIVKRVDAKTGLITTVAGGGSPPDGVGDGGPATGALLSMGPGRGRGGLAVDRAGNIYVSDPGNARIRKVDARTGIITTVAGNGEKGFSGDGGPATAARLHFMAGVAVDEKGDIYIADQLNHRIRKVASDTGIITTVAGDGTIAPVRHGVAATQTAVDSPFGVAVAASGDLYITQLRYVRRVDARTGLIELVAGDGSGGFGGDDGAASKARIDAAFSVAVDEQRNVYFVDTTNNRLRAVLACAKVDPPSLTAPAEGANAQTAVTFQWTAVPHAYRYDLLLDTRPEPITVVAADLTTTSITLSNLAPGTKFYWKVIAKGDPFCTPAARASSRTSSFVTEGSCAAPPRFGIESPPADAVNVSSSPTLTWNGVSGAASYDVYLGAFNPPPLFASTSSNRLSVSGLVPGTRYYWRVAARAACDAARNTETPIQAFLVAGGCSAAGGVALIAPSEGATVGTEKPLEWSRAANAAAYDLYLGTSNPPPLLEQGLSVTRVNVSGLAPGTRYFWRVVAVAACDPARSAATPVSQFVASSECRAPGAAGFSSAPAAEVAVGQTYVLSWTEADNLDPGGIYVIERASDSSFASIADRQTTTATSASFTATAAGTFFHRVRAVPACGDALAGPYSAAASVRVREGRANVVITVAPKAVIALIGDDLRDKKTTFTVENISGSAVDAVIGRQEIDSVPFFTVVDPLAGVAERVRLEPRTPKTLEIRFSGPSTDQAGAYQGVIFLAAAEEGLRITPYAYVNLTIGQQETADPRFTANGRPTEYTFFPGLSGDDAGRPPITLTIQNPGDTPVELGGEIAPELWLVPEPGWNTLPIPPRASRDVKVFTERRRAPHRSALPRYTYFTVRSKTGRAARILVQDNDASAVGTGRTSLADRSTRALIIPEVLTREASDGTRTFSTVRLSNVGTEPVPVELFFTPAGIDGFDALAVRRAVILAPGNDVVTLTDPLLQLWGVPQGAGQLEVRSPAARSGQLAVRASVTRRAASGGEYAYSVPAVGGGEGARQGSSHEIVGVSTDAATSATLVLAETTGSGQVSLRIVLYDSEGAVRGQSSVDIPRYGFAEIDDVIARVGAGGSITGGRIELQPVAGEGAVAGILKLLDRASGGGATVASRPPAPRSGVQSRFTSHGFGVNAAAVTFVVPQVFNGPLATGSADVFRTTIGLVAGSVATIFNLTYRSGDEVRSAQVTVRPRSIVEHQNVLEQLFSLAPGSASEGSLTIEASAPADVYARLRLSGSALVSLRQDLPVLKSPSESVISPDSQHPIYIDGLDQSVDADRGSRWMLIMQEVRGQPAKVLARLYEAGNRSSPIAAKEITLAALHRLKLDDVFAALDLNNDLRGKDRANMLLSVSFLSGGGGAIAVAMSIDRRTGDGRSFLLTPAGSSSLAHVRMPTVAGAKPPRRRAVRP